MGKSSNDLLLLLKETQNFVSERPGTAMEAPVRAVQRGAPVQACQPWHANLFAVSVCLIN